MAVIGAGVGHGTGLLAVLAARHRIGTRLDALFDVAPLVAVRARTGRSWRRSFAIAHISAGWLVPGSPAGVPGEGWSISGPIGVISGGGASGRTGWVEGVGLSGGGWVAMG